MNHYLKKLTVVFMFLLLLVLCSCGAQGNVESSQNANDSQGTTSTQPAEVETEDSRGDDSQNQSETSTIFTNDYGTKTTICAHDGCTNYIASSGDTNCCKEHSNKCLNCGKYIDEDAMYCMDCLSGDTTGTNDSGTYTGDRGPDDGCQYKYSNESVCGAKTNKYDGLCDKHFEELYDIYDSLLG